MFGKNSIVRTSYHREDSHFLCISLYLLFYVLRFLYIYASLVLHSAALLFVSFLLVSRDRERSTFYLQLSVLGIKTMGKCEVPGESKIEQWLPWYWSYYAMLNALTLSTSFPKLQPHFSVSPHLFRFNSYHLSGTA